MRWNRFAGRSSLGPSRNDGSSGAPADVWIVIASKAKQSILPREERMDCFASLAMTVWQAADFARRANHFRFPRFDCPVPLRKTFRLTVLCRPVADLPVVLKCRIPSGLLSPPNQRHILHHPVPHRGALANVTNVGAGCGGRGCVARRATLTRTAKSRGPDTPTLVSSSCGTIRENDGGKKARSPGRARRKPLKPLRREGRSVSAEPVCSCAFLLPDLHARPRVQRAPGLPCALCLFWG
jgi:hypothetical protein